MAMTITDYEFVEKTEGQGGFMDDLLALNTTLDDADYQAFADAVAEAIGRALQFIKDNAETSVDAEGIL
jgi:hypothetical protein